MDVPTLLEEAGGPADVPAGGPADVAADVATDDPGTYGDLEPVGHRLLDADGRVRLSFSRVDTYRTCPAQFRYGYVEGLPAAPSPHLSFGSAIHAALERFYDTKPPVCPTVDELLGFLYDAWDTSGFAGGSRDEQLTWYRHAQDVLRRFHAREAPRYRQPADVERWFEVPFGDDAVVVGSIDRVDAHDDGTLEVVDYKTTKRIRDRDAVRRSLQLAIYAVACEHLYGRLPAAVTLAFVVPGVDVRVPTDELDLEGARRAVAEVAAGVRAQRFPPTPGRLCGWCDFRSVCPAWEGDGPDVLGPALEELERLRRRVRRDVRTLRELEAGIARVGAEVGDTAAG